MKKKELIIFVYCNMFSSLVIGIAIGLGQSKPHFTALVIGIIIYTIGNLTFGKKYRQLLESLK
jgi:hypothetical protein